LTLQKHYETSRYPNWGVKHRVENGVAKRNLENIAFVGPNRPEKREERPLADLRAAITQEVQRQAQR
jgi:hypothetical protein